MLAASETQPHRPEPATPLTRSPLLAVVLRAPHLHAQAVEQEDDVADRGGQNLIPALSPVAECAALLLRTCSVARDALLNEGGESRPHLRQQILEDAGEIAPGAAEARPDRIPVLALAHAGEQQHKALERPHRPVAGRTCAVREEALGAPMHVRRSPAAKVLLKSEDAAKRVNHRERRTAWARYVGEMPLASALHPLGRERECEKFSGDHAHALECCRRRCALHDASVITLLLQLAKLPDQL